LELPEQWALVKKHSSGGLGALKKGQVSSEKMGPKLRPLVVYRVYRGS